jgi:hypothetical protein
LILVIPAFRVRVWSDVMHVSLVCVINSFSLYLGTYCIYIYIYIYIYTTSEKPVNDLSYGVLDRYGITILAP